MVGEAMQQWLLPTLSEIIALEHSSVTEDNGAGVTGVQQELPFERTAYDRAPGSGAQQQIKAEREWFAAIAALNQILLLQHLAVPAAVSPPETTPSGLILTGPALVLPPSDVTCRFSSWIFTAQPLDGLTWLPFHLLPAAQEETTNPATALTLPLLPGDPLAMEQFCLVATPTFSLLLVLGTEPAGHPGFAFSFDPTVVQQAWQALQPRILLMSPQHLGCLNALFEQFTPIAPDYKLVSQFSRLLLQHLVELPEEKHLTVPTTLNHRRDQPHQGQRESPSPAATHPTPVPHARSEGRRLTMETCSDVELLQAIGHEIRTPLTTIRTLTRLLLRRQDLAADVLKRLEMIDRECSEQIDRFGLIFRAVELETTNVKQPAMPLTVTSLDQVLQHNIPRWQKQASQRDLHLEVVLPQKMPLVVSDPTILDQALTGLIERFTRNLPAGSQIQVEVTLAGEQLKLQFQSRPLAPVDAKLSEKPTLKSLGQLLIFQPETGNLSLNMTVTKNIFHALGGKLTVRQRPQQGEVMTVFLPLGMNTADMYSL